MASQSSWGCALLCCAWMACLVARTHGDTTTTTATGLEAGLWPVPQAFATTPGSLNVPAASFRVDVAPNSTSSQLAGAAMRYQAIIRAAASVSGAAGSGAQVPSVTLVARTSSMALNVNTSYNYTLTITTGGDATVVCDTAYGCMYGLETLSQLVGDGGVIPFGSVDVSDYPQYRHRGFMIDTGRRFWPMDLIKSTLDGMSFTKMNVLHWHASDFCRFSIESKLYPELTANLTGEFGGFYTQSDVADIIAYAAARGIRVVPEFDIPGHTKGWAPLSGEGLDFCTGAPRIQLYDDPAAVTTTTVNKIIAEMASLFPDDVFHIGCDETHVVNQCTLDNIAAFEVSVQKHLVAEAKVPMGWEEVLFTTDAALPVTIVNAWARHTAGQVTAAGHFAVESAAQAFYLNSQPSYTLLWRNIAPNFTAAQWKLMLGGEVSMWTDNFCYITECGAFGSGKPDGWQMFPPTMDAPFSQAVNGLIWPKAAVGGHSFWHWTNTDPTGAAFVHAYNAHNTRLIARGIDSCPTSCICTDVERCGKPYVPS